MLLQRVKAEFTENKILKNGLWKSGPVLQFCIFILLVAWLVPADILKMFSVYLAYTEILYPSLIYLV